MMDSYPGPLKKDITQKISKIRSCDNEMMFAKPVSSESDMVDDTQAKHSCTVTKSGKIDVKHVSILWKGQFYK